MKSFKIIFILAVLLTVSAMTASVTAQVTIGGDNAPQNFSVLELISGTNRGLRLPQLTTSQRKTVQASFGSKATAEAMGLQIFNIDTHCVETWNGADWISTCGDPFTVTPKPVCTALDALPATVWYPYNLGADPAYDTPKKQIKKLAELAAVAQAGSAADKTAYQLDSAVFGALYQWGRIKDGHQVRGNDATTAVAWDNTITYDSNGQIASSSPKGYGKHVYGTSGNDYNWQPPTATVAQAIKDTLWGNGSPIGAAVGSSSDGAVLRTVGGSGYYQKPYKTVNDPCPSGWRLPTQDEWERLGNYECGAPNSAAGSFSTPNGNAATVAHATNNPNTTWVRVYNGKARPANTSWTNPDYNATGYAIYNTAAWTAADAGYGDGTLNLFADAAPEPLLFLPAAGYRDYSSSALYYVGLYGYYWSSTVNGAYAYNLLFASSGVNPYSYALRAYGYSVRCVCE